MKKSTFPLLIGIYFLISCNPKPAGDTEVAGPANTDSPVSLWNAAWNSNDSAAIMNLMSRDVRLISDGGVDSNIDSIARRFVGRNAKVLRNLKTETIAAGSSGDQAYYYGTYSHDVALADTTITGINGVFSFIYVKEENQWKIKVAEIEEN